MFVNISAYRFVSLDDTIQLREDLLSFCQLHTLKGTVLLSAQDGINLNLVGSRESIEAFKAHLSADPRFNDMDFKESLSKLASFKRLKVKIKPETISIRQADINPAQNTVPYIEPLQFKQWLDEGREITILDTRNDYEIEFGKFSNALELNIENFTDFPKAVAALDPALKQKPVVICCTGGIRCEKAGPVMSQYGFEEVYQLHGGILKYFEQCGGAHYDGNCFVFDDRVAINHRLEETLS